MAASVDLMAANGLTAVGAGSGGGIIYRPPSSPWSICNIERPNSWEPNSASESKRTMRSHRLEQSSHSTHLQYISTRGRSCTKVARSALWDGGHAELKRRQRSCPGSTQAGKDVRHTVGAMSGFLKGATTATQTKLDCAQGCRAAKYPISNL
jgi:hypothetical protein